MYILAGWLIVSVSLVNTLVALGLALYLYGVIRYEILR